MIILQRERPAPASLVGARENYARPQQCCPGTANVMRCFGLNSFPHAALPESSHVGLSSLPGTAFIQYP
jgi:hypothetical protein